MSGELAKHPSVIIAEWAIPECLALVGQLSPTSRVVDVGNVIGRGLPDSADLVHFSPLGRPRLGLSRAQSPHSADASSSGLASRSAAKGAPCVAASRAAASDLDSPVTWRRSETRARTSDIRAAGRQS